MPKLQRMKGRTTVTYNKRISKQTGVTEAQVKAITELWVKMLQADIEAGNTVRIPTLGLFRLSFHPGKETKHANGTIYPGVPHYRPLFKPFMTYKMKIRRLQVKESDILEHKERKLKQTDL